MNGWDALQAYDLVNDGHNNFAFQAPKRDNKFHIGSGLSAIFHGLSLDVEARELEKKRA